MVKTEGGGGLEFTSPVATQIPDVVLSKAERLQWIQKVKTEITEDNEGVWENRVGL